MKPVVPVISAISAIIGLGNPGPKFHRTRHNIGFLVLDELASRFGGTWQERGNMEIATIDVEGKEVILIKPQTFMNDSGKVLSFLVKKAIKPEHILVVHDELEMPFGKIKLKMGGSARGHNGLRSIIGTIGADFSRLCFGIDRPAIKEYVAAYVLDNFQEPTDVFNKALDAAVDLIVATVKK
jgi:PTH1 family peptidyl-tRNA hydrolase